ncbi:hypothetical protein TNCV_639371 [Trichonephila clavipes]|nr:hypothetical protein TNCV_639371 [Trichonephila clavipes]
MRCIGKGAESARDVLRYHESSPATHKILKYNPHFTAGNKEKPVNTVWQKLFVKQLMKMTEKGTLLLLLMVAGRSVVFFEEWLGDNHKC